MADDRNGPLDGYTTIATSGSHNRAKAIEIESFHVVQNNLVSLLLQSKREDSTKSVKLVIRNPQHALELGNAIRDAALEWIAKQGRKGDLALPMGTNPVKPEED